MAATLPSWAQKLNEIAIPVSNVHPEITTLSNGLKLIVQPETASATVSVFGHIRKSLLSKTGQTYSTVY
jgi:zinc protease